MTQDKVTTATPPSPDDTPDVLKDAIGAKEELRKQIERLYGDFHDVDLDRARENWESGRLAIDPFFDDLVSLKDYLQEQDHA